MEMLLIISCILFVLSIVKGVFSRHKIKWTIILVCLFGWGVLKWILLVTFLPVIIPIIFIIAAAITFIF